MDEGLVTLDQLISLLSERDEVLAEYTAMIAELLKPTAFAALQELLEAKEHQLECSDIYLSMEDLALHITCDITYGPNDIVPAFVASVAPAQYANEKNQVRSVRIGIPISYSTRPKAEILAFLQQLVKENKQLTPDPISTPTPDTQVKVQPLAQFDLSELTKDQVAQLLVFQHHTTKEKQ